MNPEEKQLLEKTAAMTAENNEMLRGMQRSMRIARFMSILYWVFIIGSAVGAYYLIQPYINSISDTYGGTKTNLMDGLSNLKDINGVIQNFKSQYGQ